MPRELNQVKADWQAVVRENDKRAGAAEAVKKRLLEEFGTHDRAEIEKILADREVAVKTAEKEFADALAAADAYVTEKKKELGLA